MSSEYDDESRECKQNSERVRLTCDKWCSFFLRATNTVSSKIFDPQVVLYHLGTTQPPWCLSTFRHHNTTITSHVMTSPWRHTSWHHHDFTRHKTTMTSHVMTPPWRHTSPQHHDVTRHDTMTSHVTTPPWRLSTFTRLDMHWHNINIFHSTTLP